MNILGCLIDREELHNFLILQQYKLSYKMNHKMVNNKVNYNVNNKVNYKVNYNSGIKKKNIYFPLKN